MPMVLFEFGRCCDVEHWVCWGRRKRMTDELMVLVSKEDRNRLLNQRIDEKFRLMNESLRSSVRVAEERAITATMVRAMEEAR